MRWFSKLQSLTHRGGAPGLIFWVTVPNTSVGALVWLHWYLTRDSRAMKAFFQYPNAFFTLLVSGLAVIWCWDAARQFKPGDVLHSGWLWVTGSAAAHLVGRALAIPGAEGFFVGPLVSVRDVGVAVAGPVQMFLLLCGLSHLARRSNDIGLFKRITVMDYVLLGVVAGFAVRTIDGMAVFFNTGRTLTWPQVLMWLSDPLLLLLLVVAVLLRKPVAQFGPGMIANCWRSFVVSIVLTAVASASSWCLDCTVRPVWMSLGWFLWFPADAAFAMGAALQVAAVERLRSKGYLFASE